MTADASGATAEPQEPTGTLGTFGGVFTPSILTILGVVMFLLVPEVTGMAGLGRALAIILIANTVSILTSLSLAVIATNTKVKGGGDYFLISRSVGLEFGGAIGSVLYVAQSVSVAFYVVGFTDALREVLRIGPEVLIPHSVFGFAVPDAFVGSIGVDAFSASVSTLVVLLLFALAFKGADIATRFQYVIMAALVAAMVSFYAGAFEHYDPALLEAAAGVPSPEVKAQFAQGAGKIFGEPRYGFWILFATFFPAVTGFTQGVSMSGDLKDPAKSLPLGTFAAVGVSLVVYLSLPFLLGGSVPREDLIGLQGAGAMKQNALVPALIDVGVFAATLSSALASLMGAPRILRAMAVDNIFPGSAWFAGGHPTEPQRPMMFTLGIALVCIWAGDLNVLSNVVAMFFLLSYGALNFATFLEGFSRNPSFRPRFRFSGWRTSLCGALVCGSVMLAIDPLATVLAAGVLFGLYRFLLSRGLESPTGDARRGFYVQRIKDYLVKLGERPAHAKTWRPVVLAVTNRKEEGRPLARFAQTVSSGQGILTLAVVLDGSFEDLVEERRRQLEHMQRFVESGEGHFFYEVVIARHYHEGIRALLQIHGIGQLRPNTLLLYWQRDVEAEYVEILNDAAILGRNVVLLHVPRPDGPFPVEAAVGVPAAERVIDVYWRGRRNGTLALLLAYLISQSRDWRGCTIRLLRITRDDHHHTKALEELENMVERSRIPAKPEVVVSDAPPFDTIADASANSHLVFMGVGAGGRGPGSPKDLARYDQVLDRLPTTILVFAPVPLDVEV